MLRYLTILSHHPWTSVRLGSSPRERSAMGQKVVVSLVDDLDGGKADETVQFSLAGKHYEIDLSDHNATGLRDALTTYIGSARRPGTTARIRSTTPTGRAVSDREQNHAIRDWAREHGTKVSDRGRIPTNVIDAYNAAH